MFNEFLYNSIPLGVSETEIASRYWEIWAGLLPEPYIKPETSAWILTQETTTLHRIIGSLAFLMDFFEVVTREEINDMFVSSAITRLDSYERMMDLQPNPPGKTLQERRDLIISKMQYVGVTKSAMKKIVLNITGNDCLIEERFYDVRGGTLPVEERFNWDIWVVDPSASSKPYTKEELERMLTIAKPEPTQFFIHYVTVLPETYFVWDLHAWSGGAWGV